MMHPRLVIAGPIQDDESLPGYVIRLAEVNGLSSDTLLKRAGLSQNFQFRCDDLSGLAQLSGSDVGMLEAASFAPIDDKAQTFNGQRLARAHLLTDGARVCPDCISELGYAKRLWHLRAYAACHIHRRALLDRCGKCERRISWGRRYLSRCNCGHTWEQGDAASVDVVAVSSRIAMAATGDAGEGPMGAIPALLQVVWFFGIALNFEGKERGTPMRAAADVEATLPVVAMGAPFLERWDAAFQGFMVDTFGAIGRRSTIDKGKSYELFRLKSAFDGQVPHVIENVRRFFADNWHSYAFVKKSFFYDAEAAGRVLSVTSASRRLGVKAATLWKFVELGLVEAEEDRKGTRTYRTFRADGVEKLRRYLSTLLTPEEAADCLGVSLSRFRKLARARYVQHEHVVGHVKRYSPRELQAFCRSLVGAHRPPADVHVPITGLRSRYFIELIREVLDGKLDAWFGAAPITSMSNIFVDRGEAESLHRRRLAWRTSAMIGTRRAEEMLGFTRRTIFALAKSTGAAVQRNDKGHVMAISSAAVEEWRDTLITADQVARPMGIAAASVARRLRQLGIVPVIRPSPEARVAGVWAKAALHDVDFTTQWVTGSGRVCCRPKRSKMKRLRLRDGRSTPEGNISFAELSGRALLDRETLRYMALNGFLQPTQINRAGCLRGVLRSSAEEFMRLYVSSGEIAKRYGLNPAAVTRRLSTMGLKPILEIDENERIRACWRREDVVGIDFHAQYVLPCGLVSAPPRCAERELLPPRRTGSPKLDKGAIYVHTASGLLGTNSSGLKAAVDAGLIRAARRSRTDKVLTVVETDVLEFVDKYVFTPKLASELGLSVKSVATNLARLQITPVWPAARPVHALWERGKLDHEVLLRRWVTAHGKLSEQSSLF